MRSVIFQFAARQANISAKQSISDHITHPKYSQFYKHTIVKCFGGFNRTIQILDENDQVVFKKVFQFSSNGVHTLSFNTLLFPGNYKIVFRSKSAKQYVYTREKEFKIQSGKSALIKLY